jgi:hypothetical protein
MLLGKFQRYLRRENCGMYPNNSNHNHQHKHFGYGLRIQLPANEGNKLDRGDNDIGTKKEDDIPHLVERSEIRRSANVIVTSRRR